MGRGDFIATDSAGKAAIGNGEGVLVDAAFDNTIGGADPGARNIISGNKGDGIRMKRNASGNQVSGNFIATDISRAVALANGTGPSAGTGVDPPPSSSETVVAALPA